MNDRFDFLRAGHRHISDSKNLKETITGLVRMAAASSGTDMGSLFLLNRTQGLLQPYCTYNLPESYLAGCTTVPVGTQCCGRAVLHRIPWVVEDMWSDPLFADCRQAARTSGIRAGFSVPVITEDGDCLGSLASHFREAHRPGQDTIETSQMLSSLIAYALIKSGEMRLSKPD